MTQLWVIVGLIIAAIAVSIQGAAFSVFGLGELFSGATLAITLIASALEFSKFVLAAYLHQSWARLGWIFKTYLTAAVVVLSAITSMGIFGYLSSAYQKSSSTLEQENIKIAGLRGDQARIASEIERLNKAIDEIPATRVSKKLQARADAEPMITKLTTDADRLAHDITQSELQILEVKKRVGPLIYIASAFKVDIDTVVKYLILILVSVIDPLAICLVIAVSESLNARRSERAVMKNAVPSSASAQSAAPSSNQSASQTQVASETASQTPVAALADEPIHIVGTSPVQSPETTVIQMRFADDEPDSSKKVI